MKINKLTATFGKFNNESITFHGGLNVIYAPNESGKKPEYIYPGQEPYCRCSMKAVLSFED